MIIKINSSFRALTTLNHFLAIAATLLFFSELASYLFNKELLPISLTEWGIFFFAGAFLLLVFNKESINQNLSRSIFKWLFLLGVFVFIYGWYPIAIQGLFPEDATDEMNNYLLTILYLFSFGVILYQESAFLLARKTMVLIAILAVGINIYDFVSLNPAQFSHIIGRAGGLYRDPNNCGIVLTFTFLLTINIIKPSYKFIYALWLFLGIVLTQSRGGILVFLLIFSFYLFNRTFSLRSVLVVGSSFIGIAIILGFSLYESYKNDFLVILHYYDSMFARYHQLLGMETNSIKNDLRADIFMHYWNLWLEQPILGHGLGASVFHEYYLDREDGTISSHNQFLTFLVDFGIAGIVLIGTFLGSLLTFKKVLLYYKEAFLFSLVFLLFAFTSHNMFDHYSLLFIYILFGRLLQYKYENGHPMIGINLSNTKTSVTPAY